MEFEKDYDAKLEADARKVLCLHDDDAISIDRLKSFMEIERAFMKQTLSKSEIAKCQAHIKACKVLIKLHERM